jgi:chromosome segregation ATPase
MIFKGGKNSGSMSEGQVPERLADKAVAFGQHIVSLEEALAEAQQQINDLERRARLAEDRVEALGKETRQLKHERDDFQRRWLTTQTKLQTAGSIILDAISETPVEEKYRARPSNMRAVEKALATKQALDPGETSPTMPAFLAAGPREHEESK